MRWRLLSIGLILAALSWAVFGQTRRFEFVIFDDSVYVYENEHVLSGLTDQSIRWAFNPESGRQTGNWHPLTWLSLMLDAEWFGDGAGGFHLTNVVFHTLNALLLFWLLQQATGAPWKSGFAAALFAVHPLHVESVAWVSERKDVLSTFFGLIALTGYVQSVRRSSAAWYATSLAAFVLSLLSKQMLVTLPFLLLLLDYWPLGRTRWGARGPASAELTDESTPDTSAEEGRVSWRRLLIEKLPFFAITFAFSAIAYLSQDKTKAVVSLDVFPLASRLRNCIEVYVLYLAKTIWPQNLACFYPHPESIPMFRVVGAAAVLLAVTAAVLYQGRRRPYLPVGWFWYLGTLVPVIGLVQIGSQRMADRYTYIPLIGIFVAVSWFVPSLFSEGRVRRLVLPAVGVTVLLVLTIVARRQAGCWRNNEALFQQAAGATKDNDLAHYNLADICFEDGRYEESIEHSLTVLRIHPSDPAARNTLGLALSHLGRYDEAIEQYLSSIAIDDTDDDVHNNLGLALHMNGNLEQATQSFLRAIEVDPTNANAHYNLGNVWGDLDRFEQAISEFEQAVEIDPENAKFRNNLGLALVIAGRSGDAVGHLNRSIEIDPSDALAHLNLAQALSQIGERDRAARILDEALRLDPSLREAAGELLQLLNAEQ